MTDKSNDQLLDEDFDIWYRNNFVEQQFAVIVVPSGTEKRTLYEKIGESFTPVIETRKDDYLHEVLASVNSRYSVEILDDNSTKTSTSLTLTPSDRITVLDACKVLGATWYESESHYRRDEALYRGE